MLWHAVCLRKLGETIMKTTTKQWGHGLPDQAHAPRPHPEPVVPHAKIPWLRNLRGDILGGITAAVLTIPVSMGYGLLALAPLGESFTSTAILAGLYAPVLACLGAVLLRANTTMIYSPRSVVTFLIGSFVLHSLVRSSVPAVQTATPEMLLTLLVGVVTCVVILLGARIAKAIPPTLLGLITGGVLYYLFVLLGWGGHLGQLVGKIPVALPTPHFLAKFKDVFMSPQITQVLPLLLTGAASLAIIASLDGLLCARLIETDTGKRVHGNGELVRLGVGNMAAASFGGIAVGINLASSFANHRSGARTPLSLLVHAAAIALAIIALSPLISYLPRVLIAAVLVVVSIRLFDRWTLQILRKLVTGDLPSARSMLDLFIILAVAAAAIATNIAIAVAIGVAATVMLFLFRMSKSVIRLEYRCDAVHSRKTREPRLMKILSDHGAAILVLELEGPLFFGTAENLALHLESAQRQNVSYVIMDLKRVTEIDSTGAKVLLQAHDRITEEGKYLVLSSFPERTRLADFLKDVGVTAALTRSRLFPDLDRAIEWAEDHLIASRAGGTESSGEFPFSRIEVLANMS